MKNILSMLALGLCIMIGISNAQDITNTLAPNGSFKIKDGSIEYLSLSQTTGYLSLNQSLVLPNTTSPSLGVIFKGTDRFIHNYGTDNTFMGINSGNFSMTGIYNTAVGVGNLSSNTTGFSNTANGSYALFSNTIGTSNTANGVWALYSNTEGASNTANGVWALYFNTTGFSNTTIGYGSLFFNTTGKQNTANGTNALYFNSTGYGNTALGFAAGNTITTGSYLTCLGYGAEPTTSDANNQITLGNGFVTSLRCNVTTITSLSDARDKKNIKDLSLGINFLMKLKPRIYNWDKRDWYEEGVSDGSKMQDKLTAGFIAQELDEAQTTENAEWLNLVLKDNPEKWEATPGNLLPIMVKAIQELKTENEQLKNEKDEEIAELKMRLTKYEEMQANLVKKIELIESSEQLLKVQIVNSENNNQ